jgi:hypothetical protein
MTKLKLNQADRIQLEGLGITEDQVYQQLSLFERTDLQIRLNRPCTGDDGIRQVSAEEIDKYLRLQHTAAQAGRFLKFVPASGAATRMFHSLYQVYESYPGQDAMLHQAARGDSTAEHFRQFWENMECFPFYEDLQGLLAQKGLALEALLQQDQVETVLAYLLTDHGLNYGSLPKALLKFHYYDLGSRTALAEHLDEAAHYVGDGNRICRLHFTISPGYQQEFERLAVELAPIFAAKNRVTYEINFSCQAPATDTVAVDLDHLPLRNDDGRLVFRPGGHGAILTNLNRLEGDLLYIKNIDNIAPEHLREPVIFWNRILGGYLIGVEKAIHTFFNWLKTTGGAAIPPELEKFARETLLIHFPAAYGHWPVDEKKNFLVNKLNRPIRVCGMVPNRGEPGGGPFWVEHKDGSLSLQIVESAQINLADPEQKKIWQSSTHFNPVHLVCSLRDHEGKPFDLSRYVDQEAVVICQKSKDGKQLKALELPGLWNGSMADWNTIFLEVPGETFCPVKTVNDLLRPAHQPSPEQAMWLERDNTLTAIRI